MSWLRLMEESIQENELQENKETSEEVKPVRTVEKHRLSTLVKEMWPAYLIEIIVIIIGISITLALEEWRDNSKESRLEKIYLKNLQADISVDEQSLTLAISETKKILEKGNQLLSLAKPGGNISAAQITEDVKGILGRPKFVSADATFSDLKSSGNLHLLEDITLKNLLFSYYNSVQNIKEVQNAEEQATITIAGPFFLKQFSLDENDTLRISPASLRNLTSSSEFRNNVLLRVANRKELITMYQQTENLMAKLQAALKKEE